MERKKEKKNFQKELKILERQRIMDTMISVFAEAYSFCSVCACVQAHAEWCEGRLLFPTHPLREQ